LAIFTAVENPQKPKNLDSLVRKAVNRDERAFSEIYDLYFEKIYRFVYFRVNHRQVAEDLVADTFVRAWDRLEDIDEIGSFNAWLFQIARNLVIDYYRAKKPDIDLDSLENILTYDDNIIDRTDLSLKQEIFLDTISKLTSDQQVVIKLKFLDELENHEIAKILNKNEGAIRVIQHRAINELKKLLNNNES
ncbi:MAG: RNA polymerase sigma factor, partial [bacterium]|nr:RNA polymerase sigma factor [bacterium]